MPLNIEHPEKTLAKLLRSGVLLAAAVVLAGAIWYFSEHAGTVPNYRAFHGEPKEFSGVTGILSGVLRGEPRALIQLGLLLMIATPVARVGLSVVLFALERDRLYVVLTLIVLATLLTSLFWHI